MKIISGCNSIRFDKTILNHTLYSNANEYDYEFYNCPNHNRPHFIKIEKILENLKIYDKVMWIDDDAFFCDKDWKAIDVFDTVDKEIIFAESPSIRPYVPLFNSGVIFVKKSKEVINFFTDALSVSRKEALSNYDIEQWGNPVGGDQDILIYLSQTKYKSLAFIYTPYYKINARPFNYSKQKIYPIVHFAGVKNRNISINNFEYTL